jgi:ElaB/YqjD/DUF883 family membrane-anchored ribosome-binding protein
MARYETPDALRHDARTLTEDTRALLDATAEITDQKIAQARQRLTETLNGVQAKAAEGVQATDRFIRSNPYQSVAIAFGVGALVGLLISRRG